MKEIISYLSAEGLSLILSVISVATAATIFLLESKRDNRKIEKSIERELRMNHEKNQDFIYYILNNTGENKTYERLLKSYRSDDYIQHTLLSMSKEIRALRKEVEKETGTMGKDNSSSFNSLDLLSQIAAFTNIDYLFQLLNDKQDVQYTTVKHVLADIVHTIRNPISGISATLMILRDKVQDPEVLILLEDIELYLAQIDENMSVYRQISKMDDDIFENTLVDLNDLLEKDIRLVVLTGGKSINVTINVDHIELPTNKARVLSTSVRCILENAVAFVEDNGSIIVESSLQDGQLDVTIENNGPIINQDIIPEIFNRGYSSRNSSGIGLAIAKEYVEKVLNGIIVCENLGEECGVRFTISFDI